MQLALNRGLTALHRNSQLLQLDMLPEDGATTLCLRISFFVPVHCACPVPEQSGAVRTINLVVSSTPQQIIRPELIFCDAINHRDGIAACDGVL